jgi:hypothetical protein
MMITPPRPPGEDYYLVVLGFRSGVDGLWTEYRAYGGSWLGIHRWLRWFGPHHRRMRIRVYQGKEEVRRVLAELRRQTALYRAMIAAQPNN